MSTTTTSFQPRPSTGAIQHGHSPVAAPSIDPVRLLKQYYKWLVVAGVFGVALGIGGHFLLLWQLPLYTAKVTLKALPYTEKLEAGGRTTGKEGGADDMQKLIATQQQIITSERLLTDAANEPAIRNETSWARKFLNSKTNEYDAAAAGKYLADHVISARTPSESVLIMVSATTRSKTDSAAIANSVVRTYLNRLQQRASAENTETLATLTRRLSTMEADRQALERRGQRMLGDSRIESVKFQHTAAGGEIQELSKLLVDLRNDYKQRRDQLANYQMQQASGGGGSFPDILRAEVQKDVTIFNLDQQLAGARSQLISARSRLGPNHPEIRRSESYVKALESQRAAEEQRLLSEKFNALIESFQMEVNGLESKIKESEENMAKAMQRSTELTQIIEDYKRIQNDLERKAKERDEIQANIGLLQDVTQSEKFKRVVIDTQASIPEKPSFPKPEIVIPITTLLCVGLVAGVLVLRELLEQRVRTPADMASIPRARVLGVIPNLDEDPSAPESLETALRDCPHGVIAEAVRQLRTAVLKRLRPEGRVSLVIAGGLPGSGATSVLANLARSCAALDERILVIDANLRRPHCHEAFGLPEGPGLGEVLAGQATLEAAVQKSDLPNLHILCAGAKASRVYERLNSDAMTRLLDAARSSYDLILVDAPPMTVSGDALVLANRCDASMFVARAYSETRGLVTRVARQLAESKGEFLGVVVNGVRSSAGGYFKKNYQMAHEYHGGTPVRPVKPAKAKKSLPEGTEPTKAA